MKAGGELRFNWQFLPRFRSEMAAAYTYAEDLQSHTPLPEIAPLDFRWKIIADFQGFDVGAAYRFAARQNRYSTAFGEMPTQDFSVFDVMANYQIFKNFLVNLEVSNIFNRGYAEYLSRTLSADSGRRIYERGRSFNMNFSYAF